MGIELLNVNLIEDATLTHSSEESSLPAENIQNPFRTKVWRSDAGWNVVSGFRDKIDFDDGGGEENATITAGNYATAALMGAEIKARMEALTGDTITVTYSGGRKFTVASSGGTLSLLWNSGTNAANNIGEDIGFDTSADDTGATSYEADNECRCSREWLGIGLDAAEQAKRLSIVSHNFSSSAVVTLYRHTSDDLSAATSVGAVTYDADFMILEFDATYRYWWIHVDDIDNSDSYIEIGQSFLGDFDGLTKYVGQGIILAEQDPSVPVYTPEGVVGKNVRTQFKVISFPLKAFLNADRDILLTVYGRVGAYKHFFLRIDPGETIFTQAALGGLYGYFTNDRIDLEPMLNIGVRRWNTSLTFEEAR